MTISPALLFSLLWLLLASVAPAAGQGRLFAPGFPSFAGVEVRVASDAGTWTSVVAADGRFQTPPLSGTDTVFAVSIVEPGEGRPRFHPAHFRVSASDLSDGPRVVLVPREWRIPAGSYGGRVVPISLHLAYSPACTNCPSFYRVGIPGRVPGRAVNPESWPANAFPLRVAFDRDHSRREIVHQDSVSFWRIAEAMGTDYGLRLFRPARFEQTLAGDDGDEPNDVILVSIDPALVHLGLGSSVSQGGDIFFGAVRVRSGTLLWNSQAPRLVTHELMHALGLGHTCSWRSVMAHASSCPVRQADRLSPEDVAYTQLLIEVREIEKAFRTVPSLEAALEGERRYLLGR